MKPWILVFAFLAGCCRHEPSRYPMVPPPAPEAHGDPGPSPAMNGGRSATATAAAPSTEAATETPEPPRLPRRVEDVLRAVNGQLEDAFFPYDRSELTGQALTALRRDAAILAPLLAEFPTIRIIVEGHCDERGSAEYNLALGDRRAMQASEVLQRFGIAADRAAPISYGKERPQCTEANEDCRQRNRRAHLSVVQTPDTR